MNKVRSTFIDFFARADHAHTPWPSSPSVPVNDPTLLFANSGMNQFKPLFLGTCDPALEMSTLKAAVNSQKCIRAGGKHNDLEDVGKDVYHHTFFEMLGNWSFGWYFKEEAITMAWNLLTVEYGINPDRLYASYFGGDDKQGLIADEEAKNIWLRFLPAERILPFGCKENFWEMGPVGPCGPCSEIHYDRIGNRDASKLVNADLPDVIEIWNIVFMQFNRETDGSLKSLPNKHVDTGMGLERVTSVLQNKSSNYDTDIFTPLFIAIQEICGCRPYQGKVGAKEDEGLVDMAYRVVADHIRTLCIAITDGAVPSSDGRGYVLRRILRRAVRYGQELLGAPNGFFARLAPVVVANFSGAFPELLEKAEFVQALISEEEVSFNRTLGEGVKHFKKVSAALKAAGATEVPGKEAHFLFTSMGFPLDLTELMAQENDLTVDSKGFEELMEADKALSKAGQRKGAGTKDMTMQAEQTVYLLNVGVTATECDSKYTYFTEESPKTAKVQAVFLGRGLAGNGFTESASCATEGEIGLILDTSSFYYESGGQIFDTGCIKFTNRNGAVFNVTNTQAYAGYVVHVGEFDEEHKDYVATVGDEVTLHVDYDRRSYVAPNHTMTHVLNFALRKVLMDPTAKGYSAASVVDQKGSLVDNEKLRFDFSWSSALTAKQVAAVEKNVCEQIQQALPVSVQLVSLAAASEISALRKLFGEAYPDPVRVVSVGQQVDTLLADPTNEQWQGYSVEFCGGTHLTSTAQAEDFVIVEEGGVAKGIRRIVGLTRLAAKIARGKAAELQSRAEVLGGMVGGPELSSLFKVLKVEAEQALISLVDKDILRTKLQNIYDTIIKTYNKALEAERAAEATTAITALAEKAKTESKACVIVNLDFGSDSKVVKKIQDLYKSIHADGSLFVISQDSNTDMWGLYVFVSKKQQESGAAGKEWVQHCLSGAGAGKGGGKADTAMGSIPVSAVAQVGALIELAQQYAASKSMSFV